MQGGGGSLQEFKGLTRASLQRDDLFTRSGPFEGTFVVVPVKGSGLMVELRRLSCGSRPLCTA